MASPVDLAPCPFCGGAAEFERRGTGRQSCIVVCGDCGARHESGDSGDRCGSSWNRRESSRPSASSSVDLAPLRAALDLDAQATPGEWASTVSPASPAGGLLVFDIAHSADADHVLATTCGIDTETIDEAERNAAAIVALHNAAPALRAALDELERLRADSRRHADARAELFTAYLNGPRRTRHANALRAFFIATEEP